MTQICLLSLENLENVIQKCKNTRFKVHLNLYFASISKALKTGCGSGGNAASVCSSNLFNFVDVQLI